MLSNSAPSEISPNQTRAWVRFFLPLDPSSAPVSRVGLSSKEDMLLAEADLFTDSAAASIGATTCDVFCAKTTALSTAGLLFFNTISSTGRCCCCCDGRISSSKGLMLLVAGDLAVVRMELE